MSESRPSTIDRLYAHIARGAEQRAIHHVADHAGHDGPRISLAGEPTTSFASCSYLGLEAHPQLIEGAERALHAYGTQFSSSRAYCSLGLNEELEALLAQIFGQPALVFPSTSLAHVSALPVLVGARDAMVLDYQVHRSVQVAAQLPRGAGAHFELARHNDLAQLEQRVEALSATHERVWYLADGIYSMHGDSAPVEAIVELLDRHPKLHLYIDDAHGMGWTGAQGCGHVRARIAHHARMVLAVSLNKSFAAAGGALLFPDRPSLERVRACGFSYIFGGPIQPPMLGAAIASARLHLGSELPSLQADLAAKIDHMRARLDDAGLPQLLRIHSPIFFVPTGPDAFTFAVNKRLLSDGFLVNVAGFPAVPMHQGGLRITVHRLLTHDDIDRLVERLAAHYGDVAREMGIDGAGLARAFRLPELAETPALKAAGGATSGGRQAAAARLTLHRADSIEDVPAALWSRCFEGSASVTRETMRTLEAAFANAEPPEARWRFGYRWWTDRDEQVVAAAPFVALRGKEDTFAAVEVSRKLEERRVTEPDYLVSRAIALGSPVHTGNPLYLDRSHPAWRDAVTQLVDELRNAEAEWDAERILLRDFDVADEALCTHLESLGLYRAELPDRLAIDDLRWADRAEWLARLGQKYRYNVRRESIAHEGAFEVSTARLASPEELDACYALYANVHARALEINVERLPRAYFAALVQRDETDVLRLTLKEAPERGPVAVMFSQFAGGRYAASIVGLDYTFLRTHGVYKQILFQTVERAHALGARQLDLGFTASLEKRKLGARPHATCAFVSVRDLYAAEVMASLDGA